MRLKRWVGMLAITMIVFLSYAMPAYAANPESDFSFSDYDGVGIIRGYYGTSKEVVIPDTIGGVKVEVIGSRSFRNKDITSITIPEGVTKIEEYAFSGNKISALDLPESLVSIGDRAFGNNLLTEVRLPKSLEHLSGFNENQISEVEIPSSVTSIGDIAFNGNQLVALELPDNLTSLGSSAFADNQLISLKIPSGLKSIGNFSFSSNQIETLEIPEGVESIGEYAFYQNLISSVTLPESILTIQNRAFSNNELLEVHIPNKVTRIESYAFNNNAITTLTLPSGLTEIGSYAFNSNKLSDVVIPGSVREIGDHSFGSNNIQNLSLGEGVTKIMYQAFRWNKLTSVGIPRTVTFYATAAGKYRNLTEINDLATSFDTGVSLYWLGEEPETGTRYETATETIPFDTIRTEDATLAIGKEKVVQAGVNGEKIVTYRLEYVDGAEVGRTVLKEEITKQPVDKIVATGLLEIREESENRVIDFETVEEIDDTLDLGTEIVKQEGVEGEAKIQYQVSYVKGEEVSRTVLDVEVVKQAIPRIVRKGTKPVNGFREETVTEVVPFETVTQEDDTLELGLEKVVQEGVDGEKIVTYKVEYENSKEIDRVFLKEEITKEPVDKIIATGLLEVREETENKVLEFDIVEESDATLDRGTEIVSQEGVNGEATVTYKVSYVKGEEVAREVVKTDVISEPVDRIVRKGTKAVVKIEMETVSETVPFEIVILEDDTLPLGEEKLEQAGSDGVKTITYRVVYIDGTEVDRSLHKEEIKNEPVNQVVRKGTKETPRVILDVNGDGQVNISDVQSIYLHVMGIEKLDGVAGSYDYNQDGGVNIADVQALYLHVMGIQSITE